MPSGVFNDMPFFRHIVELVKNAPDICEKMGCGRKRRYLTMENPLAEISFGAQKDEEIEPNFKR